MIFASSRRTVAATIGIISTCITLASMPAQTQAEQYYKWLEGGTWKYGAHPPNDVEATVVSTTVAGSRDRDESSDANADTSAAEEKPQLSEEDAKRYRQYCDTATRNLEALQSDAVIQRRDETGNVVAMSSEDKQAAMDNAKLAIERYCNKS